MENPYSPPLTAPEPPKRVVTKEFLKRLSEAQYMIFISIQMSTLSFGVCLMWHLGGLGSHAVLSIVMPLGLVICIAANANAAFRISRLLCGRAASTFLAITSSIPFVGLIPMLVLNIFAVKVLKENGVKVGWFGVDPKSA